MTSLSIAIQHRPDRADRRQWTEATVAQMRHENLSVPISVVEDTQCEGIWPTYRRSLEAAGDVSHHLVLQDDVGLCKDFIKSVEELIRVRPRDLIALYSASKVVLAARERGESWLERSTITGQAIIWPRDFISEFLSWQSNQIDQSCPSDDVRVSIWLMKTSQKAFTTVPSLVEHLGWNSSTWVKNRSTEALVAAWFIGEHRSGMNIDWSQGLDSPLQDPTEFVSTSWRYYCS